MKKPAWEIVGVPLRRANCTAAIVRVPSRSAAPAELPNHAELLHFFSMSASSRKAWLMSASPPSPGDLLLSVDGTAIEGADALVRLLNAERIGRATTLRLLRGGVVEPRTVVPVERRAR